MTVSASIARRMFDLFEPIAVVTYLEPEATRAVMALGLSDPWDAYFAGRAAPLGRDVPAGVVDALFYNFADGEVARHLPGVWDRVSPEAANLARQEGSVAALRRRLGALLDGAGVARAGDVMIELGSSASHAGRALFAAVQTLPVPTEPTARLWHGANLLREHRGDGHVAALVALGITGTESHVLQTLADDVPVREFGRLWHLPERRIEPVLASLRARGVLGADGWLTAEGRELKARLEALTDELAAPAYGAIGAARLEQLMGDLAPLVDRLTAGRDE